VMGKWSDTNHVLYEDVFLFLSLLSSLYRQYVTLLHFLLRICGISII